MIFKVMYMYFKANNFLKQENYYRWKKTKRRDEIGIGASVLLLSIEEVTVCASGSSVNWFQLNVGHIVRS